MHVFDFEINEFFVFILQIWAMEHLFSYKRQIPRSGNKYPCIMHWMNVRVGDHELGCGLRKNMVCHFYWNLYYMNVVMNLDNYVWNYICQRIGCC